MRNGCDYSNIGKSCWRGERKGHFGRGGGEREENIKKKWNY